MRGTLCVLFLALFLISAQILSAQELTGDSWAQVLESGEGEIIVTYFEEDAFAYRNNDGVLTGISVDIMRHFLNYVQNKHNLTISVEYIAENDFGKLYNSVRDGSGGVFGIANVTITEERKEELAFSPPYLTNRAVMVTHEDAADLSDITEIQSVFTGKTGILYTGTTHEERMLEIRDLYFQDMETVSVTSDQQVIELLSSGEGYFSFVDLYNFGLARLAGQPLKPHDIGEQPAENFGVIMPLHSDWAPLFTDFFDNGNTGYRGSSIYRSTLARHLGSEMLQMVNQ